MQINGTGARGMDFIYDYIPATALWTVLLMAHMLASVALIGAITHQALAVLAPVVASRERRGFWQRFRSVNAAGYAGAVCVLWVATFVFGAWVYTRYRIYVRMPLEHEAHWSVVGLFELKENITTLGMFMLPAYLIFWRNAGVAAYDAARRWTTLVLAAIAWIGFLLGHIVVNVRGLGA
jgi:hypothetical protein